MFGLDTLPRYKSAHQRYRERLSTCELAGVARILAGAWHASTPYQLAK